MIAAARLLDEVVRSLREVIAPAIAEPYPRAQAYMAAVILEFVGRQVDERQDIGRQKSAALTELWGELSRLPGFAQMVTPDGPNEEQLVRLIERLYAARGTLGEDVFARADQLVRQTLRRLLEEDLKVAGRAGE